MGQPDAEGILWLGPPAQLEQAFLTEAETYNDPLSIQVKIFVAVMSYKVIAMSIIVCDTVIHGLLHQGLECFFHSLLQFQ
jgi:hypothetical protein